MAVSRLTQTTLQNGFEKFNQLWDGRSAVGNFDYIGSYTVVTTTSSITFNSIPSTYSHLQVRAFLMSSSSENNVFRLNGDNGTNYTWHQLQGTGASADVFQSNPTQNPSWGLNSGNSTYPMVSIIDILDYANTNKNTTVRTLSGNDGTGTTASRVGLYTSVWINTSAVTSITLYNSAILADSSFSLYGVK
jgi:hypothetical protein